MKFQFSGHDSFICKHFWLKKGYDFISQKGNFTKESAVIDLGVGRNMVTAISFWLRSFGILDNQGKTTELGDFLFNSKKGVDPYIESLSTIWLLHYSLIKTNKASIYNLFFNEFRKNRIDFTKRHLLNFIKRKFEEEDQKNFTENTINTDIAVFLRNYIKPNNNGSKIDIEEDYTGLLIDLELIRPYNSDDSDGKSVEWYRVESKMQVDLPGEIVLFSILDNETYGKSIAFTELLTGYNSPGRLFALSEEALFDKINSIQNNKTIFYKESEGVRELQFRTKPNKWDVLNGCY